jgi:uncharacterized membrane protein YoaT (DUF817 family)
MRKSYIASYLVFALGCASILSMYVFSDRPQLILLLFVVLGIIMLSVIRNKRYMLWYLVAFVLGPIILDIPGMHFGLWSYGTPQLLGFPLWLPFFYGNTTVSFLYFVRIHKEL